jgi:hypothetical protein
MEEPIQYVVDPTTMQAKATMVIAHLIFLPIKTPPPQYIFYSNLHIYKQALIPWGFHFSISLTDYKRTVFLLNLKTIPK